MWTRPRLAWPLRAARAARRRSRGRHHGARAGGRWAHVGSAGRIPDPPWYNPPTSRRSGPIIQDNPNWHRSKAWCPLYRERWSIGQEPDGQGGVLLYQIICLQNTPPETEPEQALCMKARTVCWRLQQERQQARRASRKRPAASSA
jgi:hypothetical protein